MTDLTPTTAELTEVIAATLDRYCREFGRARLDDQAVADAVEAIERAFLLIPRTQLQDVTHEYTVPRDLAEDDPAVAAYHEMILHQSLAGAAADGLLIVSPPVLAEADEATRRAHPRAFIEDSRLFRLTAIGWRHPGHFPIGTDHQEPTP